MQRTSSSATGRPPGAPLARRSMGGAQGALSFTKSKAKVYVPDEESRVARLLLWSSLAPGVFCFPILFLVPAVMEDLTMLLQPRVLLSGARAWPGPG